jgi:hypothetical protein
MHFPRRVRGCLVLLWCLGVYATPSQAQTAARLAGTVRDPAGRPIAGATIQAHNPNGGPPPDLIATADARGRWGMLGLGAGMWEITVTAPGWQTSTLPVRVAVLRPNPDLDVVLIGSTPHGTLEGVDTVSLQNDLGAGEALMAAGKWSEAAATWRAILNRAPALTMVNVSLARALRMQKLYDQAADACRSALAQDAANPLALLELGRTQLESGDPAAARVTLERLIAADGTSAEAKEAGALLGQIKQ